MPGGADGVGFWAGNSLDGGDLVGDRFDRGDTGPARQAVDMDGAGTALRDTAAEFRASEPEMIPPGPTAAVCRV